MKHLRSHWSLFVLILALANLLGCEALQGRQAPASIDSPLAVTSSSLDFGAVVVGSSRIQWESITNRGTATITILQATVTSPEFTIVEPRFPLAIPPGRSARVVVRFTPQSAGSPFGVVVIAGASQSTTIALKGRAILPGKFSASPANLNFGKVTRGKTQVKIETFTNSGSTDVTVSQAAISNPAFELTGPALPLVLRPSQTATFNVAFTPKSVGSVSASLSITSSASLVASNRARFHSRRWHHRNSESDAIVPLEGTGIGQGQLTASPASVRFGSARVGKSMEKTLTLSNVGSSDLRVRKATVTGAGFRLEGMNLPVTIPAGQSVNLGVVFSPPASGNQNGSLTIVTDETSTVTLVALSGNSPVPASGTLTASLNGLSFGSVQVGNTKTRSGILTNSGNSVVTISQAVVSGSGFSGSGLVLPVKLNVGQSTAFSVSYAPTATGSSRGNLTLVSDASNSTLALSLAGTATPATAPGVLTSSLSSLNFTSVQVGKAKAQSEILTNTGGTRITVSQANLTGAGFSMSGLSLPVKLDPGEIASFTVTYHPSSEGNSRGAIHLLSDASDPTVAISLSGAAKGVSSPAILAQSAPALTFRSVQVGTTKTMPESLTNAGASAITISQANVKGLSFTLTGLSLPLTLAAGQTTNFTVTYSPTSAGISSGSLVIVSDASNSSLAASLTGTATAAPNPGLLGTSLASLNFGGVQVGNTKNQFETVKNTGGSVITISRAILAGVGFSLDGLDLPLRLDGGESFTFSVVFSPSAAKSASGSLTFVSDASNNIPRVSLAGNGTAVGQLSVTPSTLSFGNVMVGNTKSLTTTLTASNSSVTISAGEVSNPEFTLSGASFPLTISAGRSIALTLTFAPQSSGSASSNLSLATNGANATLSQMLAGVGQMATEHSVALSWDGSAAGYSVYRGTTTGGPYARLTSSSTDTASYTDASVQSGTTYFYVTTSVDSNGKESAYSNEVRATIPSP